MTKLRALQAPIAMLQPVQGAGLRSRAALSEALTEGCISSFGLLDSEDPSDRRYILKMLALCCLVRFSEPSFDPMGVINLLDFHARYSRHDEVRRECIDALALLGQTDILSGMTFELGSQRTREYRDRLLAELAVARNDNTGQLH